MSSSDIERIDSFVRRFDIAQATEIVELPWGYAVLQVEFPFSQYHNRIVVTSAAPAQEVLATTEDLLGGAGLKHRYISAVDDSVGQSLRSELTAAGYDHDAIMTMVYRGTDPEPPTSEVLAVSRETMRPAMIRDWRLELPDVADEEIAQLADRTTLYSRGAEVALLAVFDGEEIAARADLYIDRVEGLTQFENLVTHPDFRGRGHGGSLVSEALRRSRAAGCELSFLTADLQDWPYNWYLRTGYADVGCTHHFNISGD